jgi:polysaccharide biosynthesis transport protein
LLLFTEGITSLVSTSDNSSDHQGGIRTGAQDWRPYVDRPDDAIDLTKILILLRRRWRFLVAAIAIGLAIGLAYVSTTTPVYQSAVSISLDTVEAANFREVSGMRDTPLTESQVTTELEIIRSEAIAEKVVDRLNLQENTQFLTSPQTGFSRLRRILRDGFGTIERILLPPQEAVPELPPSQAELAAERLQRAVAVLRRNMNVRRLRDSRIVVIEFNALNPALAARIANGIAETYIDDQLSSRFDSGQRAAAWLQERAEQLRAEVAERDSEVERFRIANGLVGLEGNSISDFDLERISQALSTAQTELFSLQARQRRLGEIVERGDTSAAVSATATQSITNTLRSRFLDTLRDYNALVDRLGPEHEHVVRLRTQLEQTQVLMFEEVIRAEEITRSDIEIIEARIEQLELARRAAELAIGAGTEVLVQLRDLERNAETVRGLYTNFLQRYQEALQQQSFAVSDVRIINPARIQAAAVSPNTSRILAVSILIGLIVAAALIAILEYRDRKLRTEDQVSEGLGLPYLGAILSIKRDRLPFRRGAVANTDADQSVKLTKRLSYCVDKPLSTSAETLRAVKMALKIKTAGTTGSSRIVGFISCFPAEGKTTVATNFAALLASQGHRVILVDADLRNPQLSRSLVSKPKTGLVEVLVDSSPHKDAVFRENETGLDILVIRDHQVAHTSDLISGKAMGDLLERLRTEYEYVVVDLPPMAPIIDARAIQDLLDANVLVLRWGTTNMTEAKRILQVDDRIQRKSIGAVVNCFDPRRAKAYGSYSGHLYRSGDYARYYQKE